MDSVITINANVMHGVPCFAGTRVTVQTLFDHLEAGYTIDEFREQFPTVRSQQVIQLLDQMKKQVEQTAIKINA